ncbi:MAG TPA: hypothetical protein VMZ53_05180 [Kofleriaceae bacterium]|nr:hypothetical protein [Kofleriaceae bacterium]
MMRVSALQRGVVGLLACAACGRVNFDLLGGGADDTNPGDDANGGTGDGAMGDGAMGDGSTGGVMVGGSASAFGSGTINTPGTTTLNAGDTIIIATVRGISDTTTVRFAGMDLVENAPIPSFGTGPVFASIWSYRATGQTIGNASSIGNGGSPTAMITVIVHGLPANAFDRSALNAGTGTTATVGPTAITSTATEVVVALAATDVSPCAGSWATGFTEEGPASSTNVCLSVGVKLVTTAATQSATYGAFSSRNWGAAIATYRGP